MTLWNKTPDGNDIFLGLVTLDSSGIPVDGKQYWYQLQGRRGKDDVVSGDVLISFAKYDFFSFFQKRNVDQLRVSIALILLFIIFLINLDLMF